LIAGWPRNKETIKNDGHPNEFGFFAPFFETFQSFLAPKLRGLRSNNGQNDLKATMPNIAIVHNYDSTLSSTNSIFIATPILRPGVGCIAL